MATEGSVFDGFLSVVAQDAATHPSYLPEFFVSESVNRTFRGGINRTRPSIRQLQISSGENQSATIVNDIRERKLPRRISVSGDQLQDERWNADFGKREDLLSQGR